MGGSDRGQRAGLQPVALSGARMLERSASPKDFSCAPGYSLQGYAKREGRPLLIVNPQARIACQRRQ